MKPIFIILFCVSNLLAMEQQHTAGNFKIVIEKIRKQVQELEEENAKINNPENPKFQKNLNLIKNLKCDIDELEQNFSHLKKSIDKQSTPYFKQPEKSDDSELFLKSNKEEEDKCGCCNW